MSETFAALGQKLIEECGRGPVYDFPNYGNWGDGLIRHGTLSFFSDIELRFKEKTTINKDWFFPVLRGGTVIYGGGGAWCKYWNHAAANHVERFQKRFKVIVLPSTFEKQYSISNTLFFRRDDFESKVNMPSSIFCHDMAFYIGRDFLNGHKGNGVGYFFRTDGESARSKKIPEGNIDLSLKGHQRSDVTPFFAAINRFSVIHTDRLHVSLAACLLQKKTHFYEGSYFKNRAVFLSSMKDYFENVHFHESGS